MDVLLVGHDGPAEGHQARRWPAGRSARRRSLTALVGGLYGFDEPTPCTSARRRSTTPRRPAGPTAAQRLGGTVGGDGAVRPGRAASTPSSATASPTCSSCRPTCPAAQAARGGARAASTCRACRCVVHAAAPCPVEVKRADDRVARARSSTSTTRAARAPASAPSAPRSGSPTRARSASRCSAPSTSLDDDGDELPAGEEGEIWFEATARFEYHGDPEKTAARLRRPRLELARRHRPRRRGRLPLPHRPGVAHDHLAAA